MGDVIKIKPVVVQATKEKTYEQGWVSFMRIAGASPSEPLSVTYTLLPYDDEGVLQSAPINRHIPDVRVLLKTHPKLAQAYAAIIEAVTEYEETVKDE